MLQIEPLGNLVVVGFVTNIKTPRGLESLNIVWVALETRRL